MPAELIGYIAAVLTSLAFVPQVLMVIKTNDTRSISLGMYTLFAVGISLWLLYGFMLMAYPIIFANAFTLSMSLVILYKKVQHVRAGQA